MVSNELYHDRRVEGIKLPFRLLILSSASPHPTLMRGRAFGSSQLSGALLFGFRLLLLLLCFQLCP